MKNYLLNLSTPKKLAALAGLLAILALVIGNSGNKNKIGVNAKELALSTIKDQDKISSMTLADYRISGKRKKEYIFSHHGDNERQNDSLLVSEVLEAIENGIIIEQYEDTGRGNSCLLAGFTVKGKPIHIVCGELNNKIVIITVYILKPPKFKNIFERG